MAHSATYYVAQSGGSDGNSCSDARNAGTPKATINAGASCLSAGDTLIVKAGTYDEILPDIIPSGTAGAPTIVRSEPQYAAVIRPSSGFQPNLWRSIGIIGITGHHITFDGLVSDAANLTPAYHFYLSDFAHDVTITNNEIKNGGDNNSTSNTLGVVTGGFDVSSITISHNKIHDMGTGAVAGQAWYSYGMYLHANRAIVEYNELFNCSGHGIHMYNATANATNDNIVRYNRIYHNGSRGLLLAAGGDNNVAHDNLIYDNAYYNDAGALTVGGYGSPSRGNKVFNNTIYNNRARGIQLGSQYEGPVDTIVRNNIVYQNGIDEIGQANDMGSILDHNLIGTDPGFVNAAGNDFHLQRGSPAIDRGADLSAEGITTDFDGAARPVDGDGDGNAAYDIGAFEYGASIPGPDAGGSGGMGGTDGAAGSGGAGGGGAPGPGAGGTEGGCGCRVAGTSTGSIWAGLAVLAGLGWLRRGWPTRSRGRES